MYTVEDISDLNINNTNNNNNKSNGGNIGDILEMFRHDNESTCIVLFRKHPPLVPVPNYVELH